MLENLFWLGTGLVLGVVYHAKLQPYVAKAWKKAKELAAGLKTPDEQGPK